MLAVAPPEGNDRPVRFRAIFEAELDYVWTSLRRLGVQTRDLEDVTQEVFVHVYARLDVYDPARPIRPWLFAFAARCASDWRRLARHRVEVLGVVAEPQSATPGADHELDRQRDLMLVLNALEHVDIERRPVFILHDLDDCPMREITQVLGIPLFTGYSRLRLARQEFTTAVRRLRPAWERA